MGSAALFVTAQLLVASCGDSSVISTTDADAADADVMFPDVPTDTAEEDDTLVADTEVPDTEVPDTVEVDSILPDTVAPDTEVPDTVEPDTAEDTTVADTTVPPAFVDWCRLQWPLDITVGSATAVDVYGRVYVAGLTNLTTGNDTDADLIGRVGFGAAGTDPATWTSWYDATPNAGWNGGAEGEPNNDEYVATIPSFGATGDFDFAFAFSLDAGANWTTCDRNAGTAKDGSADGYHADDAGHATVVADPCSPNPCTSPPSVCNGGVLELYGTPGACGDSAGQATCDYTLQSSTDCVAQGDFCDAGTLSCVNDVCNPNPCTTPPDSICEGTEKVSYAAPGTCDDTTGTAACTFSEAGRVDCTTTTGYCVRGDCRTWRLAGVGDLVITEIMPDPAVVVDSKGEWFEVKNVADVAVNLWGIYVDDDGSDELTIGGDVVLEPGAYAVLGRLDDTATNGGVEVDYVYSGMSLSNDSDSLRLSRDGEVIDYVAWTNAWPLDAGASMQLDPAHTADDNTDVLNWCAAYTGYSDDNHGTPGAANDPCALTGLWCRLQWPLDEAVLVGTDFTVYGRVYVGGITDASSENLAHPLLVGQVGYGADGEGPDLWTDWTDATPNADYGGDEAANDEYMGTFTVPSAAGSYDFAYRFSGDGGATWIYCDADAGDGLDGSENGYQADNAGNLTVVSDPCSPNPCTTPPNSCDANVLSVYASPGTCTASGVTASCDYGTATTTNCTDTTQVCDLAALACVDDPCNPNPCTTQPASVCEGNEVVSYVATGNCTVDGGAACAYPEDARSDCGAQFCAEGACHDWRFVQAGDLLITEFMANPAVVSDANGEWFEVKNVSTSQLNLRGLTVADNASNTLVDVDLIVDAGAYAVFGVNDDNATNGGIHVDFVTASGFGLSNSGDVITLKIGDTVIDEVDYDDTGLNLSVGNGASSQLHVTATDNGDAHDWCWGTASYDANNLGTPGADNGICWLSVGWCRLQYPDAASVAPVEAFDAYGRYYVAGLTDVDKTANDASPLVRAAFAVSAPPADDNDTLNDPSTWTWVSADLNATYGTGSPSFEENNDEWTANLTAPAVPGAYLLGFRVSGDFGRTWTYCDLGKGVGHDGSEDGFAVADAGQITVTNPCDPNPCTTPPDACAGDTLSTYANPGACTVNGDGTTACDYGTATETDCTTTTGRCDADTATCVECLGDGDCTAPFEVCGDAKACVDGCVGDVYEPNDSAVDAAELTTDIAATGLVLCDGDADWYKVSLGAGAGVDLLVEPTFASGTELAVTLFAADGTTQLGTNSGSADIDLTFVAPSTADYYIVVSAAAGTKATYDLTLLFSNNPCVPNPCTDLPVASCNGNVLTAPDAPVCTPGAGDAYTCDYPTSDTTCDAFCNGGACTTWRYPENTGDLVITEYFADPSGGAAGQWFEVLNTTTDPLNLDQLEVFDLDTDSFIVDGDVIVQPGAYFVFGANANLAANGGVNVDYAWTGFQLDAAGDEIALSWLGAQDLDDIAWDGTWPATTDVSTSLNPDVVVTGASAETGNDGAGSWCLATSSYGGGGTLGTPGAPNDVCLVTWNVGFCRLQWPETLNLTPGAAELVYGRVYIAGLTDQNQAGNDPHASVLAAVGYGPTGSDPATGPWVWTMGGPNGAYVPPTDPADEKNNDEYMAPLIAGPPGTYDYAFRFSGDGGQTWLYCDKDGVTPPDAPTPLSYDPAQAGVLTVAPPAGPALFFSEYVEPDGGNNKFLEIYNAGMAPVDLTACVINQHNGGSVPPTSSLPLVGVIAPHSTFVLCHSQQNVVDPSVCNMLNGGAVMGFNGNDPLELVCEGTTLDFIGQVGTSANFAINVTLSRVCGTTTGDTDGTDAFDASAWDNLGTNVFTDLGRWCTP
ncbi:MAG: hypothetical protein EP329_17865 [Deltaproteobacteria bacterium]|nr:MAG: hypothetical protein EP329_17865 [Deltaproteobacteria bacterium]